MGIDTKHPEYSARVEQWTRCRDVVEGSDAVKNKGVAYLPKLDGQTDAEYKAYKKRALFFSAASRSLDGMVGMMMRKEPIVTAPDELGPWFKDATGKHTSFLELMEDAAYELILTGRYSIMLDWPVDGGKPYVATYVAENITNWWVDPNDQRRLIGIVLRETELTQSIGDVFIQTEQLRYRHCYINNDGVYQVDIYQQVAEIPAGVALDKSGTSETAAYELAWTIFPTINGAPLTELPVWIINPNGLDLLPIKPPVLDIVDINLSMYLNSADLEHGRHYTALPTPVITGAPADTVLKVGSMTAWAIPNEKARVYFLEFIGEGLKSLENAIKEKTSQMAQFSARLMDTSTRGSESPDTVRLRHSSESATLTGIAVSLETILNVVYSEIARFEGLEGEVQITLHKDFLSGKLTPAELRELTKAFIEGAITEEVYYYNLEKGELTPEVTNAGGNQ